MNVVTTTLDRSRALRGRARSRFQRIRTTLVGLGIPGLVLAGFVLIALFPGVLSPHPVSECLLERSLQTPSFTHPFGTDLYGCDYLTRTLYGARTPLLIGGTVTAGAMAIATLLGAWAGWYGGLVDTVITRQADAMFAIPIVLTALVVFGITEQRTMWQVIIVLTLFAWPPMVRLVRGAVRERSSYEHVQAALALGPGPATSSGAMSCPTACGRR